MMKHKRLKRFFAFLAVILCLMTCVVPVFAFDAIEYDRVEEPGVEYVYRSPVPAMIKYQSVNLDDKNRLVTYDISHDFLVGRELIEDDTYSYFHAQSGAQGMLLNSYASGKQLAQVVNYATLINMHEDQFESMYGSYNYDNVQHALILNDLNISYAITKEPQPVVVSGGDFYIEKLTKSGNLFYFYLYIKADAAPPDDKYSISCYVKANRYGSEYSDEFRYTIPGSLVDRFTDTSIPTNYDYGLVFGVPLDRLGYKFDNESGQFVDKINGKPFEGLYISEYEFSIQPPETFLPTDTEFMLSAGSYRIDLFHALQPDTYIMRDNDLDAKLSVADDINFHIDFIADAIGGFFDLQLFPGFSLGGLFLVIIAFSMVMWFLRVFGGG